MTTPEQSEPQQFNEPEYLETEGYLNRALRRLGEGLGPFVYGKVQDKKLLINDGRSIVTRDLSIIFGIMEVNWNRLDLAYDDWNCMGLLIGFRNVSWAHFAGYKDDDVLHYLGIIRRLLDAVSAAQQAQEVQRMWDELVNLIASPVAPERLQGARGESLQQQVADLQELLETLVEQENKSVGVMANGQASCSIVIILLTATHPPLPRQLLLAQARIFWGWPKKLLSSSTLTLTAS